MMRRAAIAEQGIDIDRAKTEKREDNLIISKCDGDVKGKTTEMQRAIK